MRGTALSASLLATPLHAPIRCSPTPVATAAPPAYACLHLQAEVQQAEGTYTTLRTTSWDRSKTLRAHHCQSQVVSSNPILRPHPLAFSFRLDTELGARLDGSEGPGDGGPERRKGDGSSGQ